jgi:hypothetical protein
MNPISSQKIPKILHICSKESLQTQIKQLSSLNQLSIHEIETAGVKTISDLQTAFETTTAKIVVIWNIQKLQKQYLPSILNLARKYKDQFTHIKLYIHTTVILPFKSSAWDLMEYYDKKAINASTTYPALLLNALKTRNKNLLESYFSSLNDEESHNTLTIFLEIIQKSLLKKDPNPSLFSFWSVLHRLQANCINNLITATQALSLCLEQLGEIGLVV